jgi:hypothetical protein
MRLWRKSGCGVEEHLAHGSKEERKISRYQLVRLVFWVYCVVVYCLLLKYPKDSLIAHP